MTTTPAEYSTLTVRRCTVSALHSAQIRILKRQRERGILGNMNDKNSQGSEKVSRKDIPRKFFSQRCKHH